MNKQTILIIILSLSTLYSVAVSTFLLIRPNNNCDDCLLKTDTIGANKIVGLRFSDIQGLVNSSQITSIETNKLIGLINSDNIQSLSGEKITGVVNGNIISEVEVDKLIGLIDDSKIYNLSSNKISGMISGGLIDNISSGKIVGVINSNQINTVSSDKISGLINDSQISSLDYSKLLGKFKLPMKFKNCEGTLSGGSDFETMNCDLSVTDNNNMNTEGERWVILSNYEITHGGSLPRIQIILSLSNTTYSFNFRKEYSPTTLLDVAGNSNGNMVGSMTPFIYQYDSTRKPYLMYLGPSSLQVGYRMNFLMFKSDYDYN